MGYAGILVSALVLASAAADCEVTEKYSRVKDQTTLRVDLGEIVSPARTQVELIVTATYAGKGRKAGERPDLYFYCVSEDVRRFREVHDVILLIDDERTELKGQYDNELWDGSYTEHVFAALTRKMVADLTKAKSVEGAIGIYEFKLNPEQLAAIKEFASYAADPSLPVKAPSIRSKSNDSADQPKPKSTDPALSAEAQARFDKAVADSAKAELAKKAQTKLKMAQGLEKAKKPAAAIEYYEGIVKDFPGTAQAKTAADRLKVLKPK